MKDRNENQSKHIANSLRVLGMAGFATFGYQALAKDEVITALIFASAYGLSEFMAYQVLKTGEVEK